MGWDIEFGYGMVEEASRSDSAKHWKGVGLWITDFECNGVYAPVVMALDVLVAYVSRDP